MLLKEIPFRILPVYKLTLDVNKKYIYFPFKLNFSNAFSSILNPPPPPIIQITILFQTHFLLRLKGQIPSKSQRPLATATAIMTTATTTVRLVGKVVPEPGGAEEGRYTKR